MISNITNGDDDYLIWQGEGWNKQPTHRDVQDAIACANSGGYGGNCDSISIAIDTLVRSLQFRRKDMQQHAGSHVQTKIYKGHLKRFKIEQDILKRLLNLAAIFRCKYNPQADREVSASPK